MIQDENQYFDFINRDMAFEEALQILKAHGASQMTCTKVIIKIYGLRLSEANLIVQNSIHWEKYKKGNIDLKGKWFRNG